MFPAARQTENSTHDGLTPSGVIGPPAAPCPFGEVFIEAAPAAHVGCQVFCTGLTGAGLIHPPPPVPPVIVTGAATILIHGLPAARWFPSGDIVACGAFLGPAPMARTVFMGGPGVGGLSVSVLPNGDLLVGNNIAIQGDLKFKGKVLAELAALAAVPTGQKLLKALDGDRHLVFIQEMEKSKAEEVGGHTGPTRGMADASDTSKGSPS